MSTRIGLDLSGCAGAASVLHFQLEGIMRGYGATTTGARLDGALYAVLKAEWTPRQGQSSTGQR